MERPAQTPAVTRPAMRDDLRALEGYHSPQVDVAVRLNTNESPEPPPEAWRREYERALATLDWNRYPDRGAWALREAIAGLHGVEAQQVLAANGSNEALQTLLLGFAGAGRTVVTFEPTYKLHSHIARLSGATVVEAERASDFTLDLEEVKRTLHDSPADVTFLCSPNNPTGLVEPRANVELVLSATHGLVVVDEAYGQFSDWSALELVHEERPLVVVRTFSKTWSMAAARLGYLVGPRWLVGELEKVTLPYHLDTAKQVAGILAVRHVDEMRQRVGRIVAERERVVETLGALAVDVVPSGANFVLFRPRLRGGHEVWEALLARGVLVRDCSGWPRLTDWLRVTIGTPAENDAFIEALGEVTR